MGNFIFAALLTLVLNLIWEIAQGPLYAGHTDFWATLPMCALASVGDVLITGGLYALVTLMRWNRSWYRDPSLLDWVALVGAGGLVATAVERWAIATGRWQYAAMPVVPYLNVGLLPVIQMMIIPPTVIVCLRRLHSRGK